ncbi:gluconate 2-dehydrogenase subunit 3 family protein [uncultured Algibacter sp.]|uniref:gluconate 2-dehydrogenase subunit 3 family protein n=1 Tax=uncultured Algibacter sp. TaxID=298659 RepID=UPI00260CEBA0|nr:gluconate 2-dehydrogenase subunit 3 family protein [uncultured Algibacter sp.]
MNRRKALKQLGLTIGYTAIVPSALSILQSCKSETKVWQPLFFTQNEGTVIKQLVDLILPKTKSTPGALDVNVPEFIDVYAFKAYNLKKKETLKEGLSAIMNELGVSEKEVNSINLDSYDKLLSKYLRCGKEKQRQYTKGKNQIFMTLMDLKNQSVWAFKTSEDIGKHVLAYDPIPGVQKGCISVQEATNGKDWSL